MRRAFTLLELLLVISILAMLAALLFPVFAEAKRSAKDVTCLSNVREIGLGIALYNGDADERFPWAGDPADLHSGVWNARPTRKAAADTMPPVQDALLPYLRSHDIWHCPLDSGIDNIEHTGGGATGPTGDLGDWRIAGRPTLFGAFGSSYRYRTELAFDGHSVPIEGHDLATPPNPVGPAKITIVYDAGPWHARDPMPGESRHNALMADGHAMRQNAEAYLQGLLWPLD